MILNPLTPCKCLWARFSDNCVQNISKKYLLWSCRLLKEQIGNGKSQETLDSIELQTSSEKEAEEQEETTGDGNYSSEPKIPAGQIIDMAFYDNVLSYNKNMSFIQIFYSYTGSNYCLFCEHWWWILRSNLLFWQLNLLSTHENVRLGMRQRSFLLLQTF